MALMGGHVSPLDQWALQGDLAEKLQGQESRKQGGWLLLPSVPLNCQKKF
jgi:hypothetical protein